MDLENLTLLLEQRCYSLLGPDVIPKDGKQTRQEYWVLAASLRTTARAVSGIFPRSRPPLGLCNDDGSDVGTVKRHEAKVSSHRLVDKASIPKHGNAQ